MRAKLFFAICAGCFVLHARAQVISSSPNLPPLNGQYVANGPIGYNVGGNFIQVNNLDLMNFSANIPPPTIFSGTVSSFFDVFVDLSIDFNGGPFGPATTTGLVTEQITSAELGTNATLYSAQMTQMDISGLPGGIQLRIDPVTPSTGPTAITSVGINEFGISSFFDIFTDISLDGGNTWTPALNAPALTLEPAPEPGTIALLSLGGAGLLWKRRRKP